MVGVILRNIHNSNMPLCDNIAVVKIVVASNGSFALRSGVFLFSAMESGIDYPRSFANNIMVGSIGKQSSNS